MGLHAMDLSPASGGAHADSPHPSCSPVILVGYDSSPSARAALTYAAERAGDAGRVVIAHIYGPAESWFGAPSYQPEYEDYLPVGRSMLEALEDDLPAGLPHETVLRRGSPPRELERIAEELNADEIVIGAPGSDPGRRGLGRVSLALLRDATRPLVVVPFRAAARRGAEPPS